MRVVHRTIHDSLFVASFRHDGRLSLTITGYTAARKAVYHHQDSMPLDCFLEVQVPTLSLSLSLKGVGLHTHTSSTHPSSFLSTLTKPQEGAGLSLILLHDRV
jgi:hypothetical protein